VHDARAECVGLGFRRAAVFQKQPVQPHAESDLRDLAERTLTHRRARQRRRDLEQVGLRYLVGAMPQRHVRDLVREHASHLGFVIRLLDQPGEDERRAAGQRERVHLFLVHQRERVRKIARRGSGSQFTA
jgi:hypothetical protein